MVTASAVREAAIRLLRYQPSDADLPKRVLNQITVRKDGSLAPFFSEACLYPLIGKEAARTVLALVHNLLRAQGLDPDAVMMEADRDRRGNAP